MTELETIVIREQMEGWPLEFARLVAGKLLKRLEPFAARIEIAGSIRRGKPQVGDIELLYIPKWDRTGDGKVDLVESEIRSMMSAGILSLRRNKHGKAIGFGPLNKYLVHNGTKIGVDIFATDEQNYGMALLVRTGPKDFNVKVMGRFRQLQIAGHAYGGLSLLSGKEVQCPDEHTVFRYLKWEYISPERRA